MTRGVEPFSRCAALLHIGTTGNSFKGCSVCNTSVINFRSVCWHCPQDESCHTGWKPEDTSIYICVCVCVLGRGLKWKCDLNRFSFCFFNFFFFNPGIIEICPNVACSLCIQSTSTVKMGPFGKIHIPLYVCPWSRVFGIFLISIPLPYMSSKANKTLSCIISKPNSARSSVFPARY